MLHFFQWYAVKVLSGKVCKIAFLKNKWLVCISITYNIQLAKKRLAFSEFKCKAMSNYVVNPALSRPV